MGEPTFLNQHPFVYVLYAIAILAIWTFLGWIRYLYVYRDQSAVESCPAPCMSVMPEQKVYRGAIIAIPKEDYEKLQAYLSE